MNLVWLRNDLRLDDNPALYRACQQGKKVQVAFIATGNQWRQHHEAQVKISFWQSSLKSLQSRLSEIGIPLVILHTELYEDIPALLLNYCQQNEITELHYNLEYAVNERRRDDAVVNKLEHSKIPCHGYPSHIQGSADLLNQQGLPYRVFTPWYKAWIKQLFESDLIPLKAPGSMGKALNKKKSGINIIENSDFRDDLFPATEQEAHNRLQNFIKMRLQQYNDHRDIPSLNGTSTLSPYLSAGLISARRCAYEIIQYSQLHGSEWRSDPWFRQLGWREFYRYLMLHFPGLSMNRAFIQQTESIPWEQNEAYNKAWQQGLTGFPIIDAGMRQMARTGWMHNRLRMLCASFYTKLMLCDWHEGERFFMQSLIDGDFASNNGGWQWCASTGCDASPWFRIFNPYTQSKKFDANGDFIRKLVPELAHLDTRDIHRPSVEACEKYNYPRAILDYSASRQRALERFKEHLSSN